MGLSPGALAQLLGIDDKVLLAIERGQRPITSMMLSDLQDSLGLPMEYFVVPRLSRKVREFAETAFRMSQGQGRKVFDALVWSRNVLWEYMNMCELLQKEGARP